MEVRWAEQGGARLHGVSAAASSPEIRPNRTGSLPAGPNIWSRLLTGRFLAENAAEFMLRNAQEYGDLNHYRVLGRELFQLNHPDLIADMFTRDAPNHHRNIVMQRARDVLGHGLLTSEEPLHMRQRRLAQPAFLRERIAGYAEVIGQKTIALTEQWPEQGVVDVHPAMLELALRIVGKTLFDLDELQNIDAMASAVDAFMSFLPLSFIPFADQVQRLPLPAMLRLQRGKAHLDRLIYGMIAERRTDPADRGDLLSMLLHATDTEEEQPSTGSAEAARMSDQQLHDECVTIILAGHETTANAMSFALHLLARHPEVQGRLHAEASTILGERLPSAEDYGRLALATQVFAEAMRLYPPVWVTARTCVRPYRIAGYNIPVGATLMAPQFAVHRDPRFYPEPDRFDPGRFTPEGKVSRPRLSYFPFGGGNRQCIAEGLAWMEGTLALAVIARDWALTLPPGAPQEPALKPAVSLRPQRGIPVQLRRRDRRPPASRAC